MSRETFGRRDMADALRQKANEAYLDDDFESAIAHFTQASLVTPSAGLYRPRFGAHFPRCCLRMPPSPSFDFE